MKADYIIVGAGAAGCLVANRLSADPNVRVLLLEAGSKDWNPLIHIPMLAGMLYFMPSLNWGYHTLAQQGLAGRSLEWPRGKVLGGSTAINGMMYIRGQAQDYDSWSQMGLAGWSYADVLPAFTSFECNASHLADDAYHGRHGELWTQKAEPSNPLNHAWQSAALDAGYRANSDFNGADQEGIGAYDFNIKDGRRVTAATAFLDPIRSRPNLEIETGVAAQRLLFEGKKCVGVEIARGKQATRVYANAEVIVCGGAVNTPQVLEHSGIGSGTLLQSMGIDVVLDRPSVGENLQDHLGIYLQHKCKTKDTLFGLMRPDRAVVAGLRAYFTGKGPAASVPLEVGGFVKSRPELDMPDLHITFVPGLSLAATRAGQFEHGFLANAYQLRPQSRGTIHITSPDFGSKPAIDPNYLSAEADRICLRRSVRLLRTIAEGAALDPYRADEREPGKDAQSDAAIDDWVARTANTIFHPVGTARMGADDDAVVDCRLKVRGLEGLRIMDASVMPHITSGNTAAPTMMIAERGASFLNSKA